MYKFKPNSKIRLISCTRIDENGPDVLSAFGAMGCFEEKTPSAIYRELKERGKEKFDEKVEKVIESSFGRGHGSVADQNAFIFEIENVSRATTLFLCSFSYLSHLQQSLRRANASRGYELPDSILSNKLAGEVIKLLDISFKLYEDMAREGIPNEDARYILPLYTRTNIQTLGDARELAHLWHCSQHPGVPTLTRAVIEKIIDEASLVAPKLFKKRRANYEPLSWYPAAQIYAKNETLKQIVKRTEETKDTVHYINYPIKEETIIKAIKEKDEAELSNLKHMHNGKFDGFLVRSSIVTLHQMIRQRTWDHAVESIYDAAERAEFTVPPSIKGTAFQIAYQVHCKDMLQMYKDLIANGIPENDAIGIVPHSLMVYDLIHINGWNALHALGKRICSETQWEFRKIAMEIAEELSKISNMSFLGPQCKIYGYCPEKRVCKLFGKSIKEIFLP